jgi:hypothetical protein
MQKFSLLQLLKPTCSWLALFLLTASVFLFVGPPWGLAPSFSLKTWELVVALFLSLQIILTPSIRQMIQLHIPTHMSQRWFSSLLEGCLFGLLILLAALVFNPVWDHVLLIFNGPLVIVLVATTLIMMSCYITGRFS